MSGFSVESSQPNQNASLLVVVVQQNALATSIKVLLAYFRLVLFFFPGCCCFALTRSTHAERIERNIKRAHKKKKRSPLKVPHTKQQFADLPQEHIQKSNLYNGILFTPSHHYRAHTDTGVYHASHTFTQVNWTRKV